MGVKVRPDPDRPGIFMVVAHSKKHIKNASGRRKWRGLEKEVAKRLAARVQLYLLDGIDPLDAIGQKVAHPERPDGPAFEFLALEVLADWEAEDFKHRTFKGYESLITTRLVPHFGHKPLAAIDAVAIEAYLRGLRQAGRKPSTIRNHRSLLNCLFEEAVERGYLKANPMPPASRRRAGRAARRKREPAHWKQGALAAGLDALKSIEPDLWPLAAVMGLAGLRLSEARGLKWKDITFRAGRHLRVERTLSTDGVLEGVTKTGESRQADLCKALAEVLGEYRTLEIEAGRGRPDDHIVRPSYRQINKAWNRFIEASGLPDIPIMHLRHSFAFIHVRELRSPIQWVSRQLGHKSIKMTIDTYGFAEIDSDLEAADRMLSVEKKGTGGDPKRPEGDPESPPVLESPCKTRR